MADTQGARRRLYIFIIPLLVAGFLAVSAAGSQAGPIYSFTKIADTSTGFTFLIGGTDISESGRVAFEGKLSSGENALMTGLPGELTTIASTGSIFRSLSQFSINNSGTVAFRGSLTSGGAAISVGSGGALTRIVDTVTPPPFFPAFDPRSLSRV